MCYPTPPAIYALKDVFARFGGLIDVYILHNKSYGYAKYASKASADRAVSVSTVSYLFPLPSVNVVIL